MSVGWSAEHFDILILPFFFGNRIIHCQAFTDEKRQRAYCRKIFFCQSILNYEKIIFLCGLDPLLDGCCGGFSMHAVCKDYGCLFP